MQGDAGFPDLVLVHPCAGRLIAAELKVGRRHPSLAQFAWLAAFHAAGLPAFVWTPAQWDAILEALSAPQKVPHGRR